MCYDQLGPFIFFYMLKSIKLDNRIQYNLYTIINQCTWGTYQYMYEYIFLNTCLSTRIYMYARVSANYMKLCASWPFFIGFYFFFLPKSKKNSFLLFQGISLFVEILISVQSPKFSEKIILLLLCYWKKRNFRQYTYNLHSN